MNEENKTQDVKLSSEEKIFSVFSYFGVLCLVSLILKKDNEFIKFHAKQGVVLFIIETLIGILNIVPVLGQIVVVLVILICIILSLIGMIQALMGKKWGMPGIIDLANKIAY